MGLRSAWKPCLNPHFSPKKKKTETLVLDISLVILNIQVGFCFVLFLFGFLLFFVLGGLLF